MFCLLVCYFPITSVSANLALTVRRETDTAVITAKLGQCLYIFIKLDAVSAVDGNDITTALPSADDPRGLMTQAQHWWSRTNTDDPGPTLMTQPDTDDPGPTLMTQDQRWWPKTNADDPGRLTRQGEHSLRLVLAVGANSTLTRCSVCPIRPKIVNTRIYNLWYDYRRAVVTLGHWRSRPRVDTGSSHNAGPLTLTATSRYRV